MHTPVLPGASFFDSSRASASAAAHSVDAAADALVFEHLIQVLLNLNVKRRNPCQTVCHNLCCAVAWQ